MLNPAVAFLLLVQAAPPPDLGAVSIARLWISQGTAVEKPEFQRITEDAHWKTFWRQHTKTADPPPTIDFKAHMVLVIPSGRPPATAVVMSTRPSDPTPVSEVKAWKSAESLKIRVTVILKSMGVPVKPDSPLSPAVTLVVLSRNPSPVEVTVHVGAMLPVVSTLPGIKMN